MTCRQTQCGFNEEGECYAEMANDCRFGWLTDADFDDEEIDFEDDEEGDEGIEEEEEK